MSDTFGADTIPLQVPSNGEAVGDACITRLAEYFKAFCNANAGDAWKAVMPGSNPVANVFTHNPEEVSFNERHLPALYLWRASGLPFERLSEDFDISHDMLRLLWIFPPARQEFQRQRATFVNGLAKVLMHAIEIGRDPSYVLAGDTDSRAADEGSVIYQVANIWAIEWKGYKAAPGVPIKLPLDTSTYYSLDASIELSEQRILDIVADFPAAGGLDLTIQTPDKGRDLAVGKL